VIDPARMERVLDRPLILLHETGIASMQTLMSSGRPRAYDPRERSRCGARLVVTVLAVIMLAVVVVFAASCLASGQSRPSARGTGGARGPAARAANGLPWQAAV
jgi:hypothetical protein